MKTIRITGALVSILLLTVGASLDFAYAAKPPGPPGPPSTPIEATGTGEDTTFIILSVQTIRGKTVYGVTGSGVVNGDFTGTYTFDGTITIDASGMAKYNVIDTCQCTFKGKSGTVVVEETGSGIPGGEFSANLNIKYADGDLSGLSGTGKLQGTQDPVTLLTSWTYSMSVTLSK